MLHKRVDLPPIHCYKDSKPATGAADMASAEGYTVPGQNGVVKASTGEAALSTSGRSSEPTFSAALTVWKGEPACSHIVPVLLSTDLAGLGIINKRHQPRRPAEDTRRAGSRDHR